TASGCPSDHPSTYFGAGGRSLSSPFGAPLLAHRSSTDRSSSLRLRSLANFPCALSACHGGITPSPTLSRISLARGRTSSYVNSDIGPISPGRWHPVQFLYRMGATSLVNVG